MFFSKSLGLILVSGFVCLFASCDQLRESVCQDSPMLTGCSVQLSVSPSRIKLRQQASFELRFADSETTGLLTTLSDQVQVRIRQNEQTLPLKPIQYHKDGTISVFLNEDQAQYLNLGAATIEVVTNGVLPSSLAEVSPHPNEPAH